MTRPVITTTITGRGPLQSDLGHLLDDLSNILTDDLGNRIIFHNGIFFDADTTVTGRTVINTIIT